VIVIQHGREMKIHGNTGALVGLVLENSALAVHGDAAVPFDASVLDDPALDLHVLFPLPGAPVVSPALAARPPGRTLALVVLDASWSQARKMAQRLAPLRGLPVVRLPEDATPRIRVREAPEPGQLGTAEAVALALELLGEGAAAAVLREALARVAARILAERGKLRKGPRHPPGRSDAAIL
jgi:DTW domain-containing protein